ncbi:hypothetical protein BMW22_02445 [Rhizobium leguminosarum]|uniref:PIN domain-containing protein n=1 Tax=Rhizobium leguminosarum TaxID=384 RepID=A0A1L3Z4P2_RHILE|nr:hypothetical protein [Rhizobium leguminosarum]API50644.1 hypothetical protein BMW22_02445 [Rhizobium leguminosarum]
MKRFRGKDMHILLDTSVLSEARGPKPVEEVKRFLASLPDRIVAVPAPAVFELERGGQMLSKVNPERARPLLAWLDRMLETNVYVPEMDSAVSRLIAQMATVPRFRRFWASSDPDDDLRFGCDPAIAAIAIRYGMPIVTRDILDFMFINEEFPLPGLYEPVKRRWFVEPADQWDFEPRDGATNCLVFR